MPSLAIFTNLREYAPFLSLGAGLLLSYAALYYLTRSVRSIREQRRAAEMEIWDYMGRLYSAVEQVHLQSDTPEREEAVGLDETLIGLNMQSRSKALRLQRLGHSMERISAQLKIPVSELEMLLKVNDMVMQQFGSRLSTQTTGQGTK